MIWSLVKAKAMNETLKNTQFYISSFSTPTPLLLTLSGFSPITKAVFNWNY